MTETKQPQRPVKDTKRNPCGCTLTEFEDGGRLYSPCPPCGMFQMAEELQDASRTLSRRWPFGRRRKAASHVQRAAMAMAAVATTLQQEQLQAIRQQALVDAIKKAQSDTRKMDEKDIGDMLMGPGAEKREEPEA